MSTFIRLVERPRWGADIILVKCAGCGREYETRAARALVPKYKTCAKCKVVSVRRALLALGPVDNRRLAVRVLEKRNAECQR